MSDKIKRPVKHKKIRKQPFQCRSHNENGLLLQVQNMVRGPAGDVKSTKFLFSSFSKNGERLVVVDHEFSVFIIDLLQNMFWQLTSVSSCTLVSFCQASEEVLIGLASGNLLLLDCDSGNGAGQLTGHKIPPTMLSFNTNGHLCLTAAPSEGIIWDMQTKTPAHCLVLQPETTITQMSFIPVLNHILAAFEDNVIHVWQLSTFECVTQIVPDAWHGRRISSIAFTRNGRAMVLCGDSVQIVVFMMDDWSAQKVIELPEVFEGVSRTEFISDLFDGGANKILAVLGINGDLCFLNLESGQLTTDVIFHGVVDFTCSSSGKYLSCITTARDVKIFSLAQVLNNKGTQSLPVHISSTDVQRPISPKPKDENEAFRKAETKKPASEIDSATPILDKEEARHTPNEDLQFKNNACPMDQVVNSSRELDSAAPKIAKDVLPPKVVASTRHPASHHLHQVNAKIAEAVDAAKVQRILKEYGELPEMYRPVIWRSILRLPNNIGVYRSLFARGTHPAWMDLSKKYNITNRSLLHSLQSVLSCLSHWCPAIAELPYMPLFVCPFVRFFHSNAFVCFEAVMTIIVNWCQHWFEFINFPPLNILAMVENVLGEYDPKVLELFHDAGITTKLYAWPLLSTAFSEVLSPKEWQQFWDHVLSNPPWFLIFAVVSYNSCCSVALKTCTTQDDFEFFYHYQNPINMKQFISKTYELCEKTSAENHPRQYLRRFEPLPHGNYPVLSGFPKYIVDYKSQRRNTLLREEEEILRKEHELLELKLKIEEQHRSEELKNVKEARLRDIEKATKKALEKQEQLLDEKRRALVALHADIRNHEHQLISKAQSQLEEKLSRQRCSRIAEMQEKLESKSREVDLQQQVIFDEQRTQYSRLAALRREVQLKLEDLFSAEETHNKDVPNAVLDELLIQNDRLTEKLREMQEANNKKRYSSSRKLRGQLNEIDRRNEEKEVTSAEEALRVQDYLLKSQQVLEGAHFDAETREVQTEVRELLRDLEIAYSRRKETSVHNDASSGQARSISPSETRTEVSSSMKNKLPVRTGDSISSGKRFLRTTGTYQIPAEIRTLQNLPPVRSEEFYKQEKIAVRSAMDIRAQVLAKRS